MPTLIGPIPKETARTAKAVFGSSNFYILLGEHLGTILEDIRLECLSDTRDPLFPLVTIFQALEGLVDAQAVDAVRTRMDWKFALHLHVHGPVVRESALCEFRRKVKNDPTSRHQFRRLANRLFKVIPMPANQPDRLRPLDMLLFVCSLNQMSLTLEAMHQALEVLAVRYPGWLQKIALPHWYGRYSSRTPEFVSAASRSRNQLAAAEISEDITHLLEEIHRSGPLGINKLPEIEVLYRMSWQADEKKYSTIENPVRSLKSNDCDHCIYAPGGTWKPTI